jgi:plastocyanin
MRLLWIIIVLVIGGGAWYYYGGGIDQLNKMKDESPLKAAEEAKMQVEKKAAETMAAGSIETGSGKAVDPKMVGGDALSGAETPGKKSFTILGGHFYYDIKEIKVKKGDTVTITFRSSEGKHDLKIDEFRAATKILAAGEEQTVTFVADKVGEFEYYCSVGNHRAQGQKGKLIVTQ